MLSLAGQLGLGGGNVMPAFTNSAEHLFAPGRVDDAKRSVGEAARREFRFLRDTLKRFAGALDAVQKIDAVGWKQTDNLVLSGRGP